MCFPAHCCSLKGTAAEANRSMRGFAKSAPARGGLRSVAQGVHRGYAPRTPATAAPMPPPCIPTLRGCAGTVLTCQLQVTRALPSGAQTPAAGGYAPLAGHSSCPEPTRGHRCAWDRWGKRPEPVFACVGTVFANPIFTPQSPPISAHISARRQ